MRFRPNSKCACSISAKQLETATVSERLQSSRRNPRSSAFIRRQTFAGANAIRIS